MNEEFQYAKMKTYAIAYLGNEISEIKKLLKDNNLKDKDTENILKKLLKEYEDDLHIISKTYL